MRQTYTLYRARCGIAIEHKFGPRRQRDPAFGKRTDA